MHDVAISIAGVGIGLVFGLFGAGGSAFATPVLSLLGVPGVLAVASPLPAVIPAALSGARRHLRAGNLDRRTAQLSVIGGLPGVIFGSLLSREVDGRRLLWLSGLILLGVGIRVVLPDPAGTAARAEVLRAKTSLLVGAGFGVGLLTGLLANGGGFLLVPVLVIAFGLTPAQAAGTSMTAVAALTLPTLATHIALGHIDWPVAAIFAVGVVPGSAIGAALAERIPPARSRRVFGWMLLIFAAWFITHLPH